MAVPLLVLLISHASCTPILSHGCVAYTGRQNRGTMLLLLMRALVVSCLMWPLGRSCTAAPSPTATARRSFVLETTNRQHDLRGRRWTTHNGGGGPQRAGLLLRRALCVRGGDTGGALAGQRHKWSKGVNRKPLPAPEALSRCGSEAAAK